MQYATEATDEKKANGFAPWSNVPGAAAKKPLQRGAVRDDRSILRSEYDRAEKNDLSCIVDVADDEVASAKRVRPEIYISSTLVPGVIKPRNLGEQRLHRNFQVAVF